MAYTDRRMEYGIDTRRATKTTATNLAPSFQVSAERVMRETGDNLKAQSAINIADLKQTADVVQAEARNKRGSLLFPGQSASAPPTDYTEEIMARAFRPPIQMAADDPDPILHAFELPFQARAPQPPRPESPVVVKRYLLSHKEAPRKAVEVFAQEVKSDLEKRVAEAQVGATPQPDTVAVRMPGGEHVMMAGCRVSDRVPKSILATQPANLQYHELDPDINLASLRALDEPMLRKEKLHEVYTHMTNAISSDFLSFEPPESDRKYVSLHSKEHLDATDAFMSTVIYGGKFSYNARVILNESIMAPVPPPDELKPRITYLEAVSQFNCIGC